MTVGGYPAEVPREFLISPDRFESEQEVPRFHDVALKLGLSTVSLSGGAIADDFDGDRWLDLVVSDWSPNGSTTRRAPPDVRANASGSSLRL